MNYYKCSDGTKVSQSTINSRRSAAYRDLYEGEPHPSCRGCGRPAEGTAHILPQARAKQLGLSELCWKSENMFPSCHSCNAKAENISSTEIAELLNYDTIRSVIIRYDPERASKLPR